MLKDHLEVCREEDDNDPISIGNLEDYDSEDDYQDNDENTYNTKSSPSGILFNF